MLRGARRLLSSAPRSRLVSEYCPAAMLEAGAAPAQLLLDLSDWGLLPAERQGRPVDLAELQDDARHYEAFGRERFVAACAGRSKPEIGAIVALLATQLGCRRAFIENLVFTGA